MEFQVRLGLWSARFPRDFSGTASLLVRESPRGLSGGRSDAEILILAQCGNPHCLLPGHNPTAWSPNDPTA